MNSRKTFVVVKMTNSGKDFTENWIRIQNLYEKNKNELDAKCYDNFYRYDATAGKIGYGAIITEMNRGFDAMDRFDIMTFSSDCEICLWIEDCNENDTIEYQYLALMLQKWPNVFAYIYPDSRERIQSICNKIASYFSFFVQREDRRNRIWIQNEMHGELFTTMIESESYFGSYKVLPVLEFDEVGIEKRDKSKGWGTDLEWWTRTIGEFLDDCEDLDRIRELESYREIVTKLGKVKKDDSKGERHIWRKKQEELKALFSKNYNNRFLIRCIDYFASGIDFSGMKQMEERRNLFWSKEIQDFFYNIPIISFYMLCVQLHFYKKRDFDIENDIRLLLVNGEAITEGVIQLLENLYHSSEKKGLLSIRVHENKDKSNDYLNEKYKALYMNSMADYFFEFRILDFSTQSIVESFREKQSKNEYIVPTDMGVSSFFEYDKRIRFWKDYNLKPENLVHHYGLQIFSNVVSNNGGFFSVISSSKHEVDLGLEHYCNHPLLEAKLKLHIPGTECVVLLPLQKDMMQINPSVDADIQYSFDFTGRYRVQELTVLEDSNVIDSKKYDGIRGQELKEWRINELKCKLWKQLEEDKKGEEEERKVALLSAARWLWGDIEVYCKAIMLCLIEKKPTENQGFYLIIRDCTPNVFVSITRMFAIFYGKDELCNYMEYVQIYLSGVDPSEEFLIAGKEISALFTIARKMTLVRGIQPQCLYSIEYVLTKFRNKNLVSEQEIDNLKLIPFDMLQLPGTNTTLFEQAVKRVLESDIQRYSFGCRLNNTHMRIGSKLHMNEFYEAELLFHNNYYVSRFAELLKRDLWEVLQKNCPIMFVGYETYSELLLYELVNSLDIKGHESSYMIYEERETGRFRYYNSPDYIKDKSNLIYVVIVPINSTMTTHSKVRAALLEELGKVTAEINIELNYALILVYPKDDVEEDLTTHYYTFVDKNMLRAKYLPEKKNLIRYFVTANAVWRNPLKCEKCFPKVSMLEEQPLIETNRVSIIPVQMLGLLEENILNDVVEDHNNVDKKKQEEKDKQEDEKKQNKQENTERVERLSNSLIYRHIVRKGNHFLYYFELEKYFAQNKEDIIKWLKEKRSSRKEGEGIIYDIIVAPLHHSNAGFVTEVNAHLYSNAALVLNFEIEKEYRDNVKTKYSNVIGLFKKLVDIGKEAELRFHFVDDNIITGGTYLRAKSLFTSLFPCQQVGLVKVTIFKDVIVMLNRMSRSSIMSCVSNYEDYHAYVSLYISSMRNHEDACTQCKVVENARQLRAYTSTNKMYEFWSEKMYWNRMIDVNRYEAELEEERSIEPEGYGIKENERRMRARRRMLCTHLFNEQMEEKGHLKNDTTEVKRIMLDLLERKDIRLSSEKEEIEWLISCIKVFSRPFVSYRKSSREAIFQIMLELVEFMTEVLKESGRKVKDKKFIKWGDIKNICCIIRDAKLSGEQDVKIYILLITLLQRLSDLNSNYMIRKENIKKLFTVVECFNISERNRERFQQRYLGMLKRITCLSSDENKCIYLDYLLLFGEEYESESKETEKICGKIPDEFVLLHDLKGALWEKLDTKDFQRIAFLENTRVLYDGIRDLASEVEDKDSSIWDKIKERYYYDNFKRILKYYKFIRVEGGQEYFEGETKINAMVRLYRILTKADIEEKADVEQFYDDFLECIEKITEVQSVSLLFLHDAEGDAKRKVYKKCRGKEIEIEENVYEGLDFKYDTYAFDNKNGTSVFLEYVNYAGRGFLEKDKNLMNTVYLELNFKSAMKDIELMIILKCIMMFRNLIVKRLERDFSNNLMKKWSDELNFKRHMKLERATDHTAKDELAGDFKLLVGEMKGCGLVYQKALFNLVINSYIARMNVQLLAGDLPEGENVKYSFKALYYNGLKDLIERLSIIEDGFEIVDENGNSEFSEAVLDANLRMYQGKLRYERLSIRRLCVVIVELIRSAIKYSDDRKIYIYREDQYLVVKNSFKDPRSVEEINQEIKKSYSRKRDGISLAVIKELIDTFYELDEKQGVKIIAGSCNDGMEEQKRKNRIKKYYYVKLPILSD